MHSTFAILHSPNSFRYSGMRGQTTLYYKGKCLNGILIACLNPCQLIIQKTPVLHNNLRPDSSSLERELLLSPQRSRKDWRGWLLAKPHGPSRSKSRLVITVTAVYLSSAFAHWVISGIPSTTYFPGNSAHKAAESWRKCSSAHIPQPLQMSESGKVFQPQAVARTLRNSSPRARNGEGGTREAITVTSSSSGKVTPFCLYLGAKHRSNGSQL